jgi:hypothetical protein
VSRHRPGRHPEPLWWRHGAAPSSLRWWTHRATAGLRAGAFELYQFALRLSLLVWLALAAGVASALTLWFWP